MYIRSSAMGEKWIIIYPQGTDILENIEKIVELLNDSGYTVDVEFGKEFTGRGFREKLDIGCGGCFSASRFMEIANELQRQKEPKEHLPMFFRDRRQANEYRRLSINGSKKHNFKRKLR